MCPQVLFTQHKRKDKKLKGPLEAQRTLWFRGRIVQALLGRSRMASRRRWYLSWDFRDACVSLSEAVRKGSLGTSDNKSKGTKECSSDENWTPVRVPKPAGGDGQVKGAQGVRQRRCDSIL